MKCPKCQFDYSKDVWDIMILQEQGYFEFAEIEVGYKEDNKK